MTCALAVMLMSTAGAATTGWSQAVSADIDGSLVSVSCPSSSFCAAVDDVGDAVLLQGGRWGAPNDIDGTATLSSVSCASSTFCVAAGLNGSGFVYASGSWTSTGNLDNGNSLEAVSCPSNTFCLVGDSAGNVMTYDGSSWSSPSSVDAGNSISSVSCLSSSFCVAVDNVGNALVDIGGTWSSSDIDGSGQLNSVSCASSSFCVATDAAGNVLQFDGTSWSNPSSVDTGNSITSVSCPTSGFCAAVDDVGNSQGGNALIYSGGGWSQAARIDTTGLKAVSCFSATSCVAVDDGGQAFTYPAATQPSLPTITRFAVFPPSFTADVLDHFDLSYQLSETASVHLVLQRRSGARYLSFPGSGLNPPAQAGGPGAGEASLTIDGGNISALTGGAFDTVAKLPPGTYRLEATASSGSLTGPPAFAVFKVLSPKKLLLVDQPLTVTGSGTLDATASSTAASSCGQVGERFTWGTAHGHLTAHFGGLVGHTVLIGFHVAGTYEKSWKLCHRVLSEPPSFSDGSCGPDRVSWWMGLDLRALPDVRLVGVAQSRTSSCKARTGDSSGKLLFGAYDSSHGVLAAPGNKLRCKRAHGRIGDCTIKPGSTLRFSGASTSAMCQARFRIFISVRCLPGQLSSFAWHDRESWHLTIKAGLPKCYSLVGRVQKKVRCPKRL